MDTKIVISIWLTQKYNYLQKMVLGPMFSKRLLHSVIKIAFLKGKYLNLHSREHSKRPMFYLYFALCKFIRWWVCRPFIIEKHVKKHLTYQNFSLNFLQNSKPIHWCTSKVLECLHAFLPKGVWSELPCIAKEKSSQRCKTGSWGSLSVSSLPYNLLCGFSGYW